MASQPWLNSLEPWTSWPITGYLILQYSAHHYVYFWFLRFTQTHAPDADIDTIKKYASILVEDTQPEYKIFTFHRIFPIWNCSKEIYSSSLTWIHIFSTQVPQRHNSYLHGQYLLFLSYHPLHEIMVVWNLIFWSLNYPYLKKITRHKTHFFPHVIGFWSVDHVSVFTFQIQN